MKGFGVMAMSPRRLIITGSLVLVGALLLAAVGATLRGSFNPECDTCAPALARVLLIAALPIAIFGALLVGMGIVRLQPATEDAEKIGGPEDR